MQIPILIEPVSGNGYRVSMGQPLTLSAEGATRDEALGHLREALDARLGTGAEIAFLDVSGVPHSLAPYAGMFRDNPLFDDWQQAIADYRQQADEQSEAP